MLFSCEIAPDLPKPQRQERFLEALKQSKMVTPSGLYLTMVASKKPTYLRGLRFVVAAKKQIIDGMMDLLCAVQLTKLDKIISIFGPSPGFLGTEFCKIFDMLQVHRMHLFAQPRFCKATHPQFVYPASGRGWLVKCYANIVTPLINNSTLDRVL